MDQVFHRVFTVGALRRRHFARGLDDRPFGIFSIAWRMIVTETHLSMRQR